MRLLTMLERLAAGSRLPLVSKNTPMLAVMATFTSTIETVPATSAMAIGAR